MRSDRRKVQVWFGEWVIASYTADAPLADRYAAAMSRRFAGLRITNDPLPPAVPTEPTPLPDYPPIPPEQRLWPLTVALNCLATIRFETPEGEQHVA